MNKNKTSPSYTIEMSEVLDKLREGGFSKVIDCLIENENDCYTKKGRLNKSSTCRKLNWKPKKLEDILNQMRILLHKEYDIDLNELMGKQPKEDN